VKRVMTEACESFYKPAHFWKHGTMPVQADRQQLLMEIEMFKTPKPTIVFALLGTTLATLAVSTVPVFAATTCAGDLKLTRTELDGTPASVQKAEAMGLYSSAINARSNGQDRQCVGDLNKASAVLASAAPNWVWTDAGSVGVDPASTSSEGHHDGGHDHGHRAR